MLNVSSTATERLKGVIKRHDASQMKVGQEQNADSWCEGQFTTGCC